MESTINDIYHNKSVVGAGKYNLTTHAKAGHNVVANNNDELYHNNSQTYDYNTSTYHYSKDKHSCEQ